jgi:hypothetical protein
MNQNGHFGETSNKHPSNCCPFHKATSKLGITQSIWGEVALRTQVGLQGASHKCFRLHAILPYHDGITKLSMIPAFNPKNVF